MPACRPGTAGPAIERLQQEAPDAVDMLARFAGKNIGMKEGYANQARESMAKIVLFDYVLRERLVKGQNGDTVMAGTVETALNNGFTASYLAQSAEFREAIGKITPARLEAFLNDDESRNRKFDAVVQNVLAPVKANVLGNQPVQQPQVELGQNQPQSEPKPMVPGAF